MKGLTGLRGWKTRTCFSPGAVNIPGAMVGIVVGGAILKRFQMSLRQCSAMCVLGMFLCLLVAFPLLFLGCPTQKVAGVTYSERYQQFQLSWAWVGHPQGCGYPSSPPELLGVDVDVQQNTQKWVYSLLRNS